MLPSWLLSFFRATPEHRVGHTLYVAAVAAARREAFYAAFGVPDTLDGRFDCIGVHVFLLIRHLWNAPEPGRRLGQAVFDAMFADMDRSLREIGVGDLSVPKRNRAMWEAFHGRALAYGKALDAGDAAALAEALGRNVWRGAAAGQGPALLASYIVRADRALAGQGGDLPHGRVAFPSPTETG